MEDLIKRRVVLSVENEQIGDGYFSAEVAKTLRESFHRAKLSKLR